MFDRLDQKSDSFACLAIMILNADKKNTDLIAEMLSEKMILRLVYSNLH